MVAQRFVVLNVLSYLQPFLLCVSACSVGEFREVKNAGVALVR